MVTSQTIFTKEKEEEGKGGQEERKGAGRGDGGDLSPAEEPPGPSLQTVDRDLLVWMHTVHCCALHTLAASLHSLTACTSTHFQSAQLLLVRGGVSQGCLPCVHMSVCDYVGPHARWGLGLESALPRGV